MHRYMTKLCDQVVCLVSDEDAAIISLKLGWGDNAFRRQPRQTGRVYTFKVKQTAEQEEDAVATQEQTVSNFMDMLWVFLDTNPALAARITGFYRRLEVDEAASSPPCTWQPETGGFTYVCARGKHQAI
jgi:hypothetical protein